MWVYNKSKSKYLEVKLLEENKLIYICWIVGIWNYSKILIYLKLVICFLWGNKNLSFYIYIIWIFLIFFYYEWKWIIREFVFNVLVLFIIIL